MRRTRGRSLATVAALGRALRQRHHVERFVFGSIAERAGNNDARRGRRGKPIGESIYLSAIDLNRMAPTRRQVLAGTGAVVGTACVSGAAASQITADEIETLEPPAGTWPCNRYDPGETAANPHATVPSDPVDDWRTEVPAVHTDAGFVVGPDRVHVADDRLTALDRRDGTVQWTRREPPGEIVVRAGTVYHKPRTTEPTLAAFDARTGETRWRTAIPERSYDLTATVGHLVVDGRAYDIADGRPAWTVADGASVAGDGALYSQPSSDRLIKYDELSVLDETLDRGPRPVWQQDYADGGSYPVVQEGRAVRGTNAFLDSGPALAGVDAETGRQSWSALTPAEFDAETDRSYGDPDDYGLSTPVMAVTADRCVVAAKTHSFGDPEAARMEGSALFALSPSDGSVDWSRSVSGDEHSVSDIAVADGTVIVAANPGETENGSTDDVPDGGKIRALEADTGETQWQVSTLQQPSRLAVADETIFARTYGGSRFEDTDSVIALR